MITAPVFLQEAVAEQAIKIAMSEVNRTTEFQPQSSNCVSQTLENSDQAKRKTLKLWKFIENVQKYEDTIRFNNQNFLLPDLLTHWIFKHALWDMSGTTNIGHAFRQKHSPASDRMLMRTASKSFNNERLKADLLPLPSKMEDWEVTVILRNISPPFSLMRCWSNLKGIDVVLNCSDPAFDFFPVPWSLNSGMPIDLSCLNF
eukprot:Gb_33226 [translate_table: standard]